MAIYVDNAVAQFENENALRTYPFAEGSSLLDRSGRELPLDAIVDVRIFAPYEGGALPVVRLSSVHLSKSMVSACFVSSCNGAASALSVMVASADLRPYVPYRLEKVAGAHDIGGVVTFGEMELPWSPENYFLDGALVHPCCMAPSMPAGIRRFVDARSGEELSGNVSIAFSNDIQATRNGNSIALSIDEGAERDLMSSCYKESEVDSKWTTPISSINGVRPDADGNIVLWFH